MIFKGWVDQSQTAIEVKVIADDAVQVKQIHAKEIKSLSRSPHIADNSSSPNQTTKQEANQSDRTKVNTPVNTPVSATDNEESPVAKAEQDLPEVPTQESGDHPKTEEDAVNSSDSLEDTAQIEESPEIPPEPEYNAWEVWTYLERQRLKTLKLINTFHAEWEANRFVREAERNTPPNLRIHYEIRPVLLDEAELNGSAPKTENSHTSPDQQPDAEVEDYADAIDVEIIS